jgi:hypothetical protein
MPDDDDSIHQPHDKLFKGGFKDPVNAAGFLRGQLPGTVSAAIDWETLRLEPGSFVDSHFRHCESDLLFSARCADAECRIYLLFEHISTPVPALALKLLRYMVRIWESCLMDSSSDAKLPVILPVVLLQNARVWEVAPCFSALLEVPADLDDGLRPFIPDFVFTLVQLAALPFDAIRGTPAGILTLRVMKAEREGSLLGDEVWDERLMLQVSQEVFDLVLRYLLRGDIDREAFGDRMKRIIHPQLQSNVMSLAEQLIQEGVEQGIEKGIEKGIERGQKADILEALSIRFGEIPGPVRAQIEGITDSRRIRDVFRAAISTSSIDEFIAELEA